MPLGTTLEFRSHLRRLAGLLLLPVAAVAAAAVRPQAPDAPPAPDRGGVSLQAPCPDQDLDGYVACIGGCQPQGNACGECDDTDPLIHPGAAEVCNHEDDDCDGFPDEGFASVDTSRQVRGTSNQSIDNFGSALIGLGDVNGDGVPDQAIGAEFWKNAAQAQVGSIEVVSGSDGSPICRMVDPQGGSILGSGGILAGDFNGDGVSDVAASSSQGLCLFSPVDCSLIIRCPPTGFSPLAAAGDLNLDGTPDIVVGNPNFPTGAGSVSAISGATCGTLFTYTDPQGQFNDGLGGRVARIADVTGDGRPDVLARSLRFVYILSGAGGGLVRRITEPATIGSARFNGGLVGLPDISGDGIPDLAAGTEGNDTTLSSPGSVLLFSGSNGAPIRRCVDPAASPGDRLGATLAVAGDQDGDHLADLFAGIPGKDTAPGQDAGSVAVLRSADCSVLRRFEDPAGAAGFQFGSTLDALGDLSGDGVPEVGAGPARDAANTIFRAVRLFAHESVCDADGMSPFQGDCDDTDPATYRQAPEACDARDNDCDAIADEDWDADGFDACDDCDNANPTIHPGVPEVCNGRDDDCDGATDEGADADGDGVTTPCDCNDGDAAIHPGAAETCDHVDRNCDGRMDEGSALDAALVPGPDPGGQGWGAADLASLGDVDGDGVPDFAAGIPSQETSSGPGAGIFVILSGRDRSEICQAKHPTAGPGGNFGAALAAIPDVTGDGKADLAIGAPNDGGFRGSVSIWSGSNCALVRVCTDPLITPTARFGTDVAAIGDLNGDGVGEVAATAPAYLNTGLITLFSPLDCTPVRRLIDPNGQGDATSAQSVALAGDVDQDGWPDIASGEHLNAVSGINGGSVLIYSGATGSLIRRLRHPAPQSQDYFGWSVAAVGDLTGDGSPDVAVSAPYDRIGGGPVQGSILLYSGRDGAFLRLCTVSQDHPLGTGMAGVGDMTGDGVPDFVAGAADIHSAFPDSQSRGEVILFSGADCSVVQSWVDPAGQLGDGFGGALLAAGNLGGDATPEIVTVSRRGLFIISREADCDQDGLTPVRGDCDDADAARAAGRLEICDAKDNDCDLAVDEDGDGDGFAVCADCDDAHPAAHPGGSEVCDRLDNDCDGATDEGFDPDGDGLPSCSDNCPAIANPGQADAEGDGIGDACDVETCDGFDNDGDGSVDEGLAGIPDTCNHIDDDCDGAVDPPGTARPWNSRWIGLPAPVPSDFFGQSVAGIGDVTGDRVPDLAIGADGVKGLFGSTQRGSAFIVSGATLNFVCELVDPAGNSFDRLGNSIAGLGDVSGDGVPDIAVGSSGDSQGAVSGGSVSIFSGADCSRLRKCADPLGSAGTYNFGQSLAPLADVSGDGVPDFAVGNPGGASGKGDIVVFSSADCAVVRRFSDPAAPAGARLGTAVAATGDLNGDGIGDLLAGGPGGNGGAVLFSLANGAVLRRLADAGAPAGGAFGSAVAALPDLSADGIPDLAVGAMSDDGPLQDSGSVSIFSGADGTLLRKCTDPAGSPKAGLGSGLAPYPDFDGDGAFDLVAVAPFQHTSAGPRNGTALILSGATCQVLARLDLNSGVNSASVDGDRAVAVPGDLDGDHAAEVVVGVPWGNGGFVGTGRAVVFGRTSDCDGDGATPLLGLDCDDTSAARTPGRAEVCDSIDNDCDTVIDEDSDGDGFAACADCDNGRAAAHPGAAETCNGLDDDCDFLVDDGPDQDADGTTAVCDCQDANPAMHPGAVEACNRIDDDCDGLVDESRPQVRSASILTDPAGSATGRLGTGASGIGDVNGDGVPDVAVTNGANELLILSGRSGVVHCRGTALPPLAPLPDVSGDGIPDLLARSLTSNSVAVISGASCQVLSSCNAPSATGIGSSVTSLGDINADGTPDWATGAPGSVTGSPAGQVLVFSGQNCALQYRVTDPTLSSGAGFGSAIVAPGDVTGDGWPDLVVGAPNDSSLGIANAGRVVVVSGPDGTVVRRLHDPAGAFQDRLGARLAVAGDVNGDGVKDLLAYSARDLPDTDAGAVLLFSGVGDTVLRACSDPLATASEAFGSNLAATGDLTGDGVPDFAASERGSLPGVSQAGAVLVVSGADCSIAARLRDPSPIAFGSLGLDALAVPGDLTGDGRPDIVAGADDTTAPTSQKRGHLVVFSETGSCESPDNCPAVSNPLQRDNDGDLRGNVCDVCPVNSDPLQADTDADGAGDACDCIPSDPASRFPGAEMRIDITLTGVILWTPAESAEEYLVRRGDLAARAYGNYGVCWLHVMGPRVGDTGVSDPAVPAVGAGFFYFVQAVDNTCGRGLLGFDSLERPRIETPDICP